MLISFLVRVVGSGVHCLVTTRIMRPVTGHLMAGLFRSPNARCHDDPMPEVHVSDSTQGPPDRPEWPAVVARGLTKRYDENLAVAGIDLDVPRGCFYGLVGPNGAGKTTTIRMMTALLRPDGGSAWV